MPERPPNPCSSPGCQELVTARFCDSHRKDEYRRDRQARGTAAQRGYNARHRRWRSMVLGKHPVCVDPFSRHPGQVIPATVADHVVPLSRGGGWDLENGQGLCANCHQAKTNRERLGGGVQGRGG